MASHIENEQHCYYRTHQGNGDDINGYAHQTASRIRRKRRTITNDDDDEMIVRDFLLQGGRTSDASNLESPRGVDQLALVAAAGHLLASHQGIETDETTNLKTQLLAAAGAVQPRTIDFQQDAMTASGTKAKRKSNTNAGEELLLQLSQHAGTGTSYPFDCDRDEAVVVDQQRRQRRQQQQRDDLLQFQDQAATAAAAAVSQLLQQESQQHYGDFQSSIGNDRTTRASYASTRHSQQQQQRRQRQQQRTRAQAHAHVHHDTLVSSLLSQQVQQQAVVEHPFQQVKRRKKADEERRRSEERRLLRQCSQFVSAAAAASSSSSSSGGRLWSDDTVLTRRDLFTLVTSPAPSALNGSGLSMSSFRRCNSTSSTSDQQQHQQPLRYFNNGMEVDHHGRALHCSTPSRRHYHRSQKNTSRVVSSSSSTAYTTGSTRYRNRATTNRIVAVEEDGTSLATAICLL